jgi:hypothetical protein
MPKPDNIVKTVLKDKMLSFVRDHTVGSVDREVFHVLAEARKALYYEAGKQYVFPTIVDGQVIDWSSTSGTTKYATKDQSQQWFDYVVNHVNSLGRKFIGVLGKKAPNVKCIADNQNDEQTVRRARRADDLASSNRVAWDSEGIQRHMARGIFYLGTMFGYTPATADGDRFGWIEEPVMGEEEMPLGEPVYRCLYCGQEDPAAAVDAQFQALQTPACSNCGQALGGSARIDPPTVTVPVKIDTKRYPKVGVDLVLCDVTNVVTPYYARDIKSTPWLVYEYEEHKSVLMATYPELRDKAPLDSEGDVSGMSQQGRLTRDAATSPTVAYLAPRADRWLYTRVWLTPPMYELFHKQEVSIDGQTMPARDWLYQSYPSGMRLTIIQDKIVDVFEERLADCWAACKPETSASIYCRPICSDILQIQDIINDIHNIMVETAMRSAPYLFVDPQLIDLTAFTSKSGRPMEIIPAKMGAGQSIKNAIERGPTSTVEPQIIQWVDSLVSFAQMNTGILPPIWGGDEGRQTAHEAEMKRNQALMQLSTTWDGMRRFWADVNMNAVKQLARFRADDDYSDLLLGGYHFEAEESIPMTWGQKRDQANFYLEKGPDVIHFLGLDHPINAQQIHDVLGLHGMELPMMSLRNMVLDTVRQLLAGEPVMGPDGLPMPSIMPDPSTELFTPPDHQAVVDIIKEWCRTEEGRRALETNPAGFQNVVAYGGLHLMRAMPPAPVGPDGQPLPPPEQGGPEPPPGPPA